MVSTTDSIAVDAQTHSEKSMRDENAIMCISFRDDTDVR